MTERQSPTGDELGRRAAATTESTELPPAMAELARVPGVGLERFLSFLNTNVADVIFLLRVEPEDRYSIVHVNPAFTRITGIPWVEVLGRDVRDVVPEPSLPTMLDRCRQAIRDRSTMRWHGTSTYPAGTKHAELTVSPVFDAAGRCAYLFGIARDLTEEWQAKRTEAELRASEARLRILIEATPAGVAMVDRDIRYIACSRRWITDYKLEGQQIIGRCHYDIFPELPQRWKMDHQRALRGESLSSDADMFVRADGSEHYLKWALEPWRDASGVIGGLILFTENVTDRMRAEDEIRKLNVDLERRVIERTAQLEAANRELTAFSYSVSHDLRAPLRHINGYLDMLRREAAGALSAKAQRYMDVASESARELSQLIDDLLAYSRVGRASMEIRECDLGVLVREVLRELEPDTRGRRIEWGIQELPHVMGDAPMLKLVLTNLLDNAIKFTAPKAVARIEVGCQGRKDGRAVFFVRDNGVGFEDAYKDKLFGVFQRLHRPDEFEGTGIGLANVHRIISRHGGETWAEGVLGEGATFYFTLRLAAPEGKELAHEPLGRTDPHRG